MTKGGAAELPTAIVVGGGFVGVACAWQLVRAGFRTKLIDRGDKRLAASWGNAGHLAIEQLEPLASLHTLRSVPSRLAAFGGPVGLPLRGLPSWFPFGLRLMAASAPSRFAAGKRVLKSCLSEALPAWRRLAGQTGNHPFLREDGHFVVWESSATAEAGRRKWLDADIGDAVALEATVQELEMLRGLFDGRPRAALKFRNTGQVFDLMAMWQGIERAFLTEGGVRVTAVVQAVEMEGRRAALALDGRKLTADRIVIAAGIGSTHLVRGLEGPVPMIAERGYHVEAPADPARWPENMPPVAFEDRSVIVTRFASTLRLAGFTEFARAEDQPDARNWARLERHADDLGLSPRAGRTRWMGSRPTLPDYLPVIGPSKVASNLIYAFGHHHLGVTLAAVTGEFVAALATGVPPRVDLGPLALARFA